MLFQTKRTLKEQVFGTKIDFVDFGERDSLGVIDATSKASEEELIDNFGAPVISIGKEFKGSADIVDGKVTIVTAADSSAAAIPLQFVLADISAPVTKGFCAPFVIDAKKEKLIDGKAFTVDQIAEAKCLLFEKIITERLSEAITGLKAKTTSFESEILDEIAIPIPVVASED